MSLPTPPPDDFLDILPHEGFMEVRYRGTYSDREYRNFIVRSI
jgi:hypothetical protein